MGFWFIKLTGRVLIALSSRVLVTGVLIELLIVIVIIVIIIVVILIRLVRVPLIIEISILKILRIVSTEIVRIVREILILVSFAIGVIVHVKVVGSVVRVTGVDLGSIFSGVYHELVWVSEEGVIGEDLLEVGEIRRGLALLLGSISLVVVVDVE